MSGTKRWIERLQELPIYHEGRGAFLRGIALQDLSGLFDVYHGDEYEALKMGWRDAETEATSP